MEWVPHTCLFLNPNDSIVKLMCSIVNSVSLWCSPSYKKDVKFWELKKKKKKGENSQQCKSGFYLIVEQILSFP